MAMAMFDGDDDDGRGFEVSQKALSNVPMYSYLSQAHKGTKKSMG